jgi:hypothetical protein
MEPIRHTLTARPRSLKMYRGELDHLIALFQKSCQSVVISDNQNRYGSLDEMKATVGSKIKNLDIRGEKPGLHFLLNQKEYPPGSSTPAIFNELRTEEITDEADALFLKVREFLYAQQRPSPTRYLVPAILGLVVTFGFIIRSIQIAIQQGQRGGVSSGIVASAIITLLIVIAGAVNSQNRLTLETRLNSPSFFTKNREEFFKQAFTALIGGGIGWLLGHFGK